MRTILNFKFFNVQCPAGMTEASCPARQCLGNAWRQTINPSDLEPGKVGDFDNQVKAIRLALEACVNCRGGHNK